MPEQPLVPNHQPVMDELSRPREHYVHMTIGELWRYIHRAPDLTAEERDRLAEALRRR